MKKAATVFYIGIGLVGFGWLVIPAADALIGGGLLTGVGMLWMSILYVSGK